MTPAISVLMPVYNGETYLAEAVESILQQTYGDFEFIIVDDGSTDSSLPIARSCADRDRRIRIVSRPNTGIVGALNDGLAIAQGEFVARMDADDISLPDRFERQIAYLRAHPECVVLGTAIESFREDGVHVEMRVLPQDDAEIRERIMHGEIVMCHASLMIRREVLAGVGNYSPRHRLMDDLDVLIKLSEVGQCTNLPDVLFRYRLRASSMSHTRRLRRREEYLARQAVVRDAFARRGQQLPRGWEIYNPSHVILFRNAARDALRSGSYVRAAKFLSTVWCEAPFRLETYRMIGRDVVSGLCRDSRCVGT